jgi:hypothetical protein
MRDKRCINSINSAPVLVTDLCEAIPRQDWHKLSAAGTERHPVAHKLGMYWYIQELEGLELLRGKLDTPIPH